MTLYDVTQQKREINGCMYAQVAIMAAVLSTVKMCIICDPDMIVYVWQSVLSNVLCYITLALSMHVFN